MLVTRCGPLLRLVTHPAHGRLAGQLAEHWGNERFAAPTARAALLTAATHHDDGWAELDGEPAYNASEQRPAHFLELPLEETVAPYRRGVDSVYDRDPHAGALVSMHWAGLYSARWGQQSGPPVGHPLARQVVAEEERRWVAALRESWGLEGLRSRFEADTWHAYEVLQALDFLALALSLLDLTRATEEVESLSMPQTLRSVEQPPGARIIPAVPTVAGGEHVDVRLRVPSSGCLLVEPYPFGAPQVQLTLPVRELEDRAYSSGDSAATYHDATIRQVPITITGAV